MSGVYNYEPQSPSTNLLIPEISSAGGGVRVQYNVIRTTSNNDQILLVLGRIMFALDEVRFGLDQGEVRQTQYMLLQLVDSLVKKSNEE